jgi:cell wall-associated NlpC family hydrolase
VLALGAGALLLAPVLFAAALIGVDDGPLGTGCASQAALQPGVSRDAEASIPADYLDLYRKAGQQAGIAWNLLAAVGKVESDHGRDPDPHSGVHSGANHAGAAGPMQIGIGAAATNNWGGAPRHRADQSTGGYGVDGSGDGWANVHDPADAIPGAAAMLKANGAPGDIRGALFAYNPSWDYVNLVLHWAKRYARGDFTPVQANPADCAGNDIPAAAGDVVQRIIAFALAQRGKPYVFGANGPDAWDCSSLLEGAYHNVGLTIPPNTFTQWDFGVRIGKGTEQPGDLVFFNSGPGTSADNPGHVGMVIGPNKMIVARCSTCRPAITVTPYKRADWVGATRPLAHPTIRQQLQSKPAE